MKALTLWQPWASAIACGLKQVETRHWPTRYRGPLAIAATKTTPKPYDGFFETLDRNEAAAFAKIGIVTQADLPRSAIVCTCELYDCIEMTAAFIDQLCGEEKEWGIYQVGRFAWLLRDVRPLPAPPPHVACGRTLWEWRVAA